MRRKYSFSIENPFTFVQFSSWIQGHDYGASNTKNVPAQLNVKKHSLGQNAAQMKCLFINIPFILIRFKFHPDLQILWKLTQTLLRIVETVHSSEITENDLTKLEEDVEFYLKSLKYPPNVGIIPKGHFMVHYAHVIREMGPIAHMSTLRYEARHQLTKKLARGVNNFVNINKTIAMKNQKQFALQGFSYANVLQPSKSKQLTQKFYEMYKETYSLYFDCDLEDLKYVIYLRFNNCEYRSGICILHNFKLFEIDKVICHEQKYYFLCNRLHFVSYDTFLNSLELIKDETVEKCFIQFDETEIKKTYDLKNVNGKKYIIMDTLELRHIFSI